ncbi:hypothetical protein 268TH004_44 [Bacillus phage 268TH004]|uniref:Uncharacterized protein n=1 Tax=Bacillus phage 268TH004 TaxID=2801523 RepID=A0A7T7ZAN6_9CAUD|nr:hypothetical protein 276BB001_44 [Bacillus phage 276BB001]QFG05964.1 hypothetical protein 280BB001_44 [Bacillus phage 280BB001]QQO40389.1 hypothetical protein 268TH004_44 [Bacillus phage 268TH004]QZA70113.1 hypothetical protein 274BB002_44 [Bacillus phage 274BB002]
MSEKTITISLKEYTHLKDRELFLECLEGAGVDNWQGYSDAWEMYKEEDNED